jgi:hypothetical protein
LIQQNAGQNPNGTDPYREDFHMNIVRQLAPDEYEKWNDFVKLSPETGLFQTIPWNQMICETSPRPAGFLPLVSLNEKGIQAGIVVCYRFKSGRRISDLPFLGYMSPALSPELNYAGRQHTYKNYTILADLLNQLAQEVGYIRMENGPEIWDIRAYEFLDWNIQTTYTHIWQGEAAKVWAEISDETRRTLEKTGQKYAFREDTEWENMGRFLKESGGEVITPKRVDWLRERDACRLYFLENHHGAITAITLAVLSRENGTSYLWGSRCLESGTEKDTLSLLYWKSYERLADEFPRMDLGGSNCHEINLIKDRLGCKPTPRYITTFGERKFLGNSQRR